MRKGKRVDCERSVRGGVAQGGEVGPIRLQMLDVISTGTRLQLLDVMSTWLIRRQTPPKAERWRSGKVEKREMWKMGGWLWVVGAL